MNILMAGVLLLICYGIVIVLPCKILYDMMEGTDK